MGRNRQLWCRSQTKVTAKLPKVLPTTLEWQIPQAGSLSSHANHFTTLPQSGQKAKYSSTLFQNKCKTIKKRGEAYQSVRLSMLEAWKYIEVLVGWKREGTIYGRGLLWSWLLFCSRHGEKFNRGQRGKHGA